MSVSPPMRRSRRSRNSRRKFQKRFNYKPDHNGIKGYTAVYAVKYVTEKKLGKFDRKALRPGHARADDHARRTSRRS